MKTEIPNLKKLARQVCLGTPRYGGRGRTDRTRHTGWSTPVVIVNGSDAKPKVMGLGYWKTGFRRNGFSLTLYTPSTLRIVVGENWNPFSAYDNDNH